MKLEQSFDIEAPLEEVWKALIDIERIAPCLPGANVTERDDEGAYHGEFVIKLGPTTASYRGVLRIDEIDESAHRATLHARGTDKRGQGGATATIVNTLTPTATGTHVSADTDLAITGKLARFGRPGMIQDVSNRLMREFASCLQSKLATAEPEPEPEEAEVPVEPAAVAGPAEPAAPRVSEGPPAKAPAPQAAKPIGGIGLFLGVLLDRIRRLLRRR